ncbi:MAG: SDR family oxidoreductase [Planctomycetaceae bacterium]|nr:SDR family oxidoreductase [Planctomycetaceae bacterium]
MAAAASVPGSDATRLDGKTAVVTGASSGIGRAIARELALAGADVVVHARASHAQLDRVVDELRATGRRALAILADLASAPAHAALIEQAWTWAGDIQIWVNNAGGDVLTGSAAEWPFEQKLEYLWQVDVRGTILLSREVGRRMIERAGDARDRCILNMGWDQVEGGMAGDSGEMFAAVKGAVMAFTRSLARSLAPAVRVNCLAPGWIRTAWGRGAAVHWQERARRESLLQRWGAPEDVARVARCLVSPASGFVTGQVIPVNGGFAGSAAD